MLEWITWDSFEFEKASRILRYSFPDPCAFYSKSHYAPFWCDLCSSFDHNITSCPFYARYLEPDLSFPLAQCLGLEVGDPFGFTKFDVGVACCELEDVFDVVHNLVETPLEVSCDV